MPSDQIGLRHRISRLSEQVGRQHRHLEELRAEVAEALRCAAPAEACRWLEQFNAALVAHFELEQNIFFPALHGLDPSRKRELEALEREHVDLLADLASVLTGIGSEGWGDAALRFQSCLDRLRGHERIEERLVGAISSATGS
jgi:hypothetical protein